MNIFLECMYMHHFFFSPGALRRRWKELDPLKQEPQMAPDHLCWCWEWNSDPMQEQQMSSVAESSHRPSLLFQRCNVKFKTKLINETGYQL